MCCGNKESCRIVLKKQIILPFTCMSQYILSLLIFVVNNSDQFLINSEIHNISTTCSSILRLCSENLDIYQKGVYYSSIKIFRILLLNIKKFLIIQGHLFTNSYNTLDEYCSSINREVLGFLDFVNFVFKTSTNAVYSIYYVFHYSFKAIFYSVFY